MCMVENVEEEGEEQREERECRAASRVKEEGEGVTHKLPKCSPLSLSFYYSKMIDHWY